jgi:hypothetical protein
MDESTSDTNGKERLGCLTRLEQNYCRECHCSYAKELLLGIFPTENRSTCANLIPRSYNLDSRARMLKL